MNTRTQILTHGTALALGIAAFAFTGGPETTATSEARTEAGKSGRSPGEIQVSSGTREPSEQHRPIQKLRSSEYRKAWDAIADQSLPAPLRTQLQMALLTQWAEVDLDGALTAAFDTSWDGVRGSGGIEQLLFAFGPQFAKQPVESWDLITSGKYGLGAALAKAQWARSVVEKNPLLVANSLRQIPLDTRRSVFPKIVEAIRMDPSQTGAFYKKIAELPQDGYYLDMVRHAIGTLGARGTTDEIRSKFVASTSDAERTLLVHEYGKSLSGAGMDSIRSALSALPEADQGRMLRSIAIHSKPGENTTQLVELLLKTGEYSQVYIQAEEHLREYGKDPANHASLAGWAVNLPESQGSGSVIRRSLEPYFSSDPEGARNWLETLPANLNKDRALAEFARQMVSRHRDAEGSEWALAQINDPKIRQDTENWAKKNTPGP